ncbi:MAG: hypothetical protein NTV34_10630 [Proteobacteria bacterium]|nr:hypothetical protein [Pseudomonadota bacterium]
MNSRHSPIYWFLALFCLEGCSSTDSRLSKDASAASQINSGQTLISCKDVVEGDDVGGRFESSASFDSKIPLLNTTITIDLTGMEPTITKTTLLSVNSVCERPIDFAKFCQFQEGPGHFGDYGYTFSCGSEISFGEIYFSDGAITFRCQGPNVDSKYSGGGVPILGCILKKP